MKIDNFALTMWQTCPAKFDLSINQHWQPKQKSAALNFGAVIHSGLEAWYQGWLDGLDIHSRLEKANERIKEKWPTEMPVDDHRTLSKALEVMRKYAAEYPGENFTIEQVEVAFTLDTGLCITHCVACDVDNELDDPEVLRGFCVNCGEALEPIEYGGIIDTVTSFGPVLYVLEHKTTSQMGPLYFRQYETSNQITGYCWALKQLSGKRIAGANINAICITRGGKIEFKRESTNRNDQDFERWRRHIQSECNDIMKHKRTGIWPYRTEQCLQKWGLCPYHGVHTLSTPVEMQRRLESDYEQRPWDHEMRDMPEATSG